MKINDENNDILNFDYKSLQNCWKEQKDFNEFWKDQDKVFIDTYESDLKLIQDGTIDMRIAFDPFNLKNQFLNESFCFNKEWKRLFQSPWIHQKSQEWLSRRRFRIQGSDLTLALALGEDFERFDRQIAIEKAHDYLIELKKNPSSFDDDIVAIKHGNDFEPKAGYIYTLDHRDLTFQFGVIDHPNTNYLLGVSPDLISWVNQCPVELKCPRFRNILKGVSKEDIKSLKVLEKEMLWDGKVENYKAIINLEPKFYNFMKTLEAYYHQCQLQMEVIQLNDESMIFAQYGTNPNSFYEKESMITYSTIKKDNNWISTNMKYFESIWSKMNHKK